MKRAAQPTPEELERWREAAAATLQACARPTAPAPRLHKALKALQNRGKSTVVPDGPPTAEHAFVRFIRKLGLFVHADGDGRAAMATEMADLANECLTRLDQGAGRKPAGRSPYAEDSDDD